MKLLLATLSMMCLSGCWVPVGSTYKSEGTRAADTTFPDRLLRPVPAYGVLELPAILRELVRLEVVKGYPPGEIPGDKIQVLDSTRVIDLIRTVEVRMGWCYDTATSYFYYSSATHRLDGPDAFGRPSGEKLVGTHRRPHLSVQFRFRRMSAGASARSENADAFLNGGVTGTAFAGTVPDGVPTIWNSSQERSYFEGIQSPVSDGAPVVNTVRKTVSAGLSFEMLAARLPGELFRMDGSLEISSFLGRNGLERQSTRFPIQIDGPRNQWCTICVIRGADLGADLSLRHFGSNVAATAEQVELQVRVD